MPTTRASGKANQVSFIFSKNNFFILNLNFERVSFIFCYYQCLTILLSNYFAAQLKLKNIKIDKVNMSEFIVLYDSLFVISSVNTLRPTEMKFQLNVLYIATSRTS